LDITDKLGYSPEELTQLLPISLQTLTRDRSKGHLGIPFTKVGHKVVYPADKVREWLNTSAMTPLQYKSTEINVGSNLVKRSKGRPKGTTKVELSKRKKLANWA
jgi:hypothetical protein